MYSGKWIRSVSGGGWLPSGSLGEGMRLVCNRITDRQAKVYGMIAFFHNWNYVENCCLFFFTDNLGDHEVGKTDYHLAGTVDFALMDTDFVGAGGVGDPGLAVFYDQGVAAVAVALDDVFAVLGQINFLGYNSVYGYFYDDGRGAVYDAVADVEGSGGEDDGDS